MSLHTVSYVWVVTRLYSYILSNKAQFTPLYESFIYIQTTSCGCRSPLLGWRTCSTAVLWRRTSRLHSLHDRATLGGEYACHSCSPRVQRPGLQDRTPVEQGAGTVQASYHRSCLRDLYRLLSSGSGYRARVWQGDLSLARILSRSSGYDAPL